MREGFLEKGRFILDNTNTMTSHCAPKDGQLSVLDKGQIEEIIPHRKPFLLLDRVVELVPGEYAVAEKDILSTDEVFQGHFPGHPVFPGVLQLEALAQTGCVALLSEPEAQGKIVLFAGVDNVRFKRPVVPGDTLRLETRLGARRGPLGKGEGKAYVGSTLVCSGTLTFALVDR
jgi:3-hydroxyacyl-[acyl-carrier-protein] dehydratase